MRRRIYAFTLVELLVVIGIIALLISMLLPALNRARQQANMIDCEARLHEMGHALDIYVSQYHGLLPWGIVDRRPQYQLVTPSNYFTNTPSDKEQVWWWTFTLSEILTGRSCLDPTTGLASHVSPIFKDKDTIQGNDYYWVDHYTSNPRVLMEANGFVAVDYENVPQLGSNATVPISLWHQRNITDVKNSSNVFVIWDGPQIAIDCFYNTYPSAEWIDAFGWVHTGLVFEDLTPPLTSARAILPGGGLGEGVSGRTDGSAKQKAFNSDFSTYMGGPTLDYTNLRFRHMNNTVLNALCLDGHVETRRVGTVMVGDIYTNFQHGQVPLPTN
jgi:type II secretory pathway pseudopilin PulG